MKLFTNSVLLSIALLSFTGCGGGSGGGNDVVTPPSTSTNNSSVTTTSYQGLKGIGATNAGTATVSSTGAYTYIYNGTSIDLTSTGISAGSVVSTTTGGVKKVLGGSTYSYSRFGGIAPSTDLTKSEVFYVGTKTTTMPTTGTATYSGQVIDSSLANNAVTFNVNYGAKTITGATSTLNFTNGTITGSDFAGTVTGNGAFKGSFFGTNAAELGGTGTTAGNAFSFGAKK